MLYSVYKLNPVTGNGFRSYIHYNNISPMNSVVKHLRGRYRVNNAYNITQNGCALTNSLGCKILYGD